MGFTVLISDKLTKYDTPIQGCHVTAKCNYRVTKQNVEVSRQTVNNETTITYADKYTVDTNLYFYHNKNNIKNHVHQENFTLEITLAELEAGNLLSKIYEKKMEEYGVDGAELS